MSVIVELPPSGAAGPRPLRPPPVPSPDSPRGGPRGRRRAQGQGRPGLRVSALALFSVLVVLGCAVTLVVLLARTSRRARRDAEDEERRRHRR